MRFQALPFGYTVQHAGGSTEIVVNQQQPSAGWFRLGAFSMAPGENHHVEVAGALEGVTVADAIRFVSAGVSASNMHKCMSIVLGYRRRWDKRWQARAQDA